MKQQEIPYIHYVRVLALFLVLGTHCNHGIIYNNETDRLFSDIVHTLCQPCVPLFFMITGVLITFLHQFQHQFQHIRFNYHFL